MASSPITSWEVDGETGETVSDFIFLASKINADGDCSHEIKRHLLLGRKVMTNLAAAAKSLQSYPTVQPHRRQPTRLLCPWDFPGKSAGVGCQCLLHDQPRQHIKGRDVTLPTKVCIVKAMVFQVVMYRCEC